MKNLNKIYKIEASAEQVYKALTNVAMIEEWSGSPADIDLQEGGEFSLWEGDIHGYFRKITPHQIVQDWKESHWDTFSKVTFNISEKDGITTLELIHQNIPDRSFLAIGEGWDAYYLGPLKELAEG
jgi:activator of HSP90 ATPase